MSTEEFEALLKDIDDETIGLMATLAEFGDEAWDRATPAVGWNIHDQIVHLAFFDDMTVMGFTDPEKFVEAKDEILATGDDYVDQISHSRADMNPTATANWLRDSRSDLLRTFRAAGPSERTPWFGPPMSAASSASARLMETWAHGQDVYDALGVEHPVTDRIRHVCHLGVITRPFSYAVRGLEVPPGTIRVELVAPDGSEWSWGPADATDRVTGPAIDFALVATQRRHRADTSLTATPGIADDWMSIAQAFAGNVGTGREPGQFS